MKSARDRFEGAKGRAANTRRGLARACGKAIRACTGARMDALEDRRLLAATLVGEYLFEETNGGTTVIDSSATGNHGTFDTGVMRSYGWDGGGALEFDGAGAVTTAMDLNQWLGKSGSLTAWVWTNEYGSPDFWRSPGITGVEVDPHADDIFWGVLDGGGGIGVRAGNDPGAYTCCVANRGWQHVAFTRDMDTGAVKTYLNGLLANSATSATGPRSTAFHTIGGIEVLDIITGVRRQPNYWIGGLDDVRIYDGVLTNNEVRQQVGLPPLPEPTIGSGTGLLGTYTDFSSGTSVERLDPNVNFTWPGAPHPAIAPDGFGVVWEGYIEGQHPEEYWLSAIADDEIIVYVDGEQLLYTFAYPYPEYAYYPVLLNPGELHSIRVEMREYGGLARAQLFWESPSAPRELVPSTQLHPLREPIIVTSAGISGPTSGTEGSSITLDGVGVGTGELEYAWIARRGGEVVATGAAEDLTFTLDDDGIYEVDFTVTADDGTFDTATHLISVANVVPVLTASGGSASVEGSDYVLNLAAADPGDDAIIRWFIDWGDGSDPDGDGVPGETVDGGTSSASHAYTDDGRYAIAVRGEDEDGSYDANLGTQYFITQAWGSWNAVAAEAASKNGYLVSINDAEEQALIESLFLTPFPYEAYWIGLSDEAEEGVYRWADGTLATYTNWNLETGEPNNYWGPHSENFVLINFNFAAQGSGPVGTWNDEREFVPYRGIIEVPGADPVVVDVANAAPQASIVGPSSAVRGQVVSLTGLVADAGVDDALDVAWTISDGTSVGSRSADDPGALEVNHAFDDAGTYTVTLEVWDDDGGYASATHVIEVKVVDLQPDPADPTKTTLAVGGSAASEVVVASAGEEAGTLTVTIDDVVVGTFAAPAGTSFGSILLLGNGGDDHLIVGGGVTVNALLDGGEGHDLLKGGRGDDLLLGGAGDDLLNGGYGTDAADGGDGEDLLVSIEQDLELLPAEARTLALTRARQLLTRRSR